MVSDAQLEALNRAGNLRVQEPVSVELLARIREGALNSRTIQLQFANLIIEQGLVDDAPDDPGD